MAIVRVFATEEEVNLLSQSLTDWDQTMPCADTSKTSTVDLILVSSKDLATNAQASDAVQTFEEAFASNRNWTKCFAGVKNMSANLSEQQDQYDGQGYQMNRFWVTGPNTIFKEIMTAMFSGAYRDMYESFFLMEMDAVPVKPGWLDTFVSEAEEMPSSNMAIRGSKYLGYNWDTFMKLMPSYVVNHINGNAIYNLLHPWTRFLYDTFSIQGDVSMDDMAFDVAYSMMTTAAMAGTSAIFADAWARCNCSTTTYNSNTMLIANYANTLMNSSFEVSAFVRHVSKKNIFENLAADMVTLAVAEVGTNTETFLASIATNHPFKSILLFMYSDETTSVQVSSAPSGNVTTTIQPASMEPWMLLCEVAETARTSWFALASTMHIINAPVHVLMDGKNPILPYVPATSESCTRSAACAASISQAEMLFGVALKFHHDINDVLFNTSEAKAFCADWNAAAGNMSWQTCELNWGPTADDYVAWKISKGMDVPGTPKDKTRHGWRPWTTLWSPMPIDERNCSTPVYGQKDYDAILDYTSACSLMVEDEVACTSDSMCKWRPLFETGVCVFNTMGNETWAVVEPVGAGTSTSTSASGDESELAKTVSCTLSLAVMLVAAVSTV